MENKYFVPAIEDIHIGYKCELLNSAYGDNHWIEIELDEEEYQHWIGEIIKDKEYGKWLRVPYLTKEQIEKEGWKLREDGIFYMIGDHGGYLLELESNYIIKIVDLFGVEQIYYGKCKDINTLRYICKLLKIT